MGSILSMLPQFLQVHGEQRFITLGLLRGRVVVIAHTERGDEVRIMSMREGTKREQTSYFRSLADWLETH